MYEIKYSTTQHNTTQHKTIQYSALNNMLSLEFKPAWGETGVKTILKIERYAQRLTQGYMEGS